MCATWCPAWLQGGISEAYVGAVRVFGIGSKMLFEQVTRLDNQEMVLGWQLITHPGKTCSKSLSALSWTGAGMPQCSADGGKLLPSSRYPLVEHADGPRLSYREFKSVPRLFCQLFGRCGWLPTARAVNVQACVQYIQGSLCAASTVLSLTASLHKQHMPWPLCCLVFWQALPVLLLAKTDSIGRPPYLSTLSGFLAVQHSWSGEWSCSRSSLQCRPCMTA